MIRYEYRCTGCERTVHSLRAQDRIVTDCCHAEGKRIFGFQYNKPMQPHFNHSIGKYVSNEQQFADGLKEQSEAATLRTGIEHNFVPVDPTDRKTLGVTDEAIDA